jgi:hypothetical protein|tara:strand:- start:42 stop:290 length:249 start_codon:yes stop_codon:yes gene_type:complete
MQNTETINDADGASKAMPFLLELDEVNNVGACSPACHKAISWLINEAASKSDVVLNQTMPDGSTRQFTFGRTPTNSVCLSFE